MYRINRLIGFAVICLVFSSPVLAGEVKIFTPGEIYQQGIEAYQQSDFLSTIDLLNKALPELRDQDTVVEAHRYLAKSYIALLEEDKGRGEFVQILKLKPDFAIDPLDSPKIVEIFEQARKIVFKEIPFSVKAVDRQGKELPAAVLINQEPRGQAPVDKLMLSPGQYRLTVTYEGFIPYSQEITVNEVNNFQQVVLSPIPPPPKSHFEKAKEFYAAQRYDQTIEELQQALLEPTAGDEVRSFLGQVYYQRGIGFYQEQKFDEAVSYLSKAVLENPQIVEAYFILGKTYLNRRGMAQKAIEELERVIQLSPDHIEALNSLASAYTFKPDVAGRDKFERKM